MMKRLQTYKRVTFSMIPFDADPVGLFLQLQYVIHFMKKENITIRNMTKLSHGVY